MENFKRIYHQEFNNLILYEQIDGLEREFGLCTEFNLEIYISSQYLSFYQQLANSRQLSLINSIHENMVCKIDDLTQHDLQKIEKYKPIVLTSKNQNLEKIYTYNIPLSNSDKILYFNENYFALFQKELGYYYENNILNYDNLIHYCMIVKNAGDILEKVLTENLPIIDKWTILDTGSSDNTIDIINKVLVGIKKGNLYKEPFINFRESRNRCLDLCGKTCKYNLMLDDTYVIKGDLRGFLNEIRSDQFADSYSLLIISDDVEYYSNRVTKTEKELRYIYTLHEVIQKDNNVNVVIPKGRSYIHDYRSDYMETRTMARKEYDLKCLFEMIEEEPENPRHYYYVAQTYNVMGKYNEAAEYFYKRAFHPSEGFDQEKIDALFEMTRIYNFKLNKPWEECEKLYKLCYSWDEERPDSVYFIGIHYYLEGDYQTAFQWLKKGFQIGYPIHRQYSLKPTLSYHFLPKFLTELCYRCEDFLLGEKVSRYFLEHNKPTEEYYSLMTDWYKIFQKLNKRPSLLETPISLNRELFVFVVDGNWNKWTGRDILTKGLGGSETWAVETAGWIKKLTNFEVIIFCNTENEDEFNGVKYLPLERYYQYIANVKIKYSFISRYSEYIPVSICSHVENIYIISHDLSLSGMVIPLHPKIKKIFTLTDWHKQYLSKIFPQFVNKIDVYNYGIDVDLFNGQGVKKVKNSFIYSSFPNRGLIVILRMWKKILEKIPDATLNIFCDLSHSWTNQYYGEEIEEIKELLKKYSDSITNHNWVSKKELAEFWKKSEVWFYPCKFKETFCLTALEAACSQTLVISNHLAALQNTVGDRGVVIEGNEEDVLTGEWQNKALIEIEKYLLNKELQKEFIEKNWSWAMNNTWKERTRRFLEDIDEKIIEKIYIDFETYTGKEEKLINKFWSPIENILQGLYQICERNKYDRILELGPGIIPFKYATNFIDFHVKDERYTKVDLDCEKIDVKDGFYQFGYARHLFEDLQNPDFAIKEMTRVCNSGYIETPSPLIEILRDVDAGTEKELNLMRGYKHHRWIVWSDYETNTIHFFPKYCILQYLKLNPDFENKLISIANHYPLYWNNYYFYSPERKSNYKVYKLYGSDLKNIPITLIEAIKKSILYTNNVIRI